MLNVFDTVLTSSDMSIERVLRAGLPVTLLVYENELPGDLRHALDEAASQHAGKVLVVMLARSDGAETIRRFDIHHFPTLLSLRDGKPVARQEYATPADVQAHTAYLAGKGPLPAARANPGPASSFKPATGPNPQPAAAKGPMAVNEANFEQEVLRSPQPVLVDFWAEWCGPCRIMEPTLEKLAHQHGDRLKIVKVNVDENPAISSKYGITGIPTMMVVENGQVADRMVGALPEGALRNRLARWIQAK